MTSHLGMMILLAALVSPVFAALHREDLASGRVLKVELTPREREIAALLVEGLTSKGVGKRLDISPRTVDVYRARLMRKTSLNN